MPDDAKKSNGTFGGEHYSQIRIDTEHAVNELLAVMRVRREEAVDRHLRDNSPDEEIDDGTATTEADSARLTEIMVSHSTGFAHALLQGAVEAFDDQTAGLKLLKRLIEAELVEMEQDANFGSQATSAGSIAIN